MGAAVRGWLLLVGVCGTLFAVPAIAWTAWLLRRRPRPMPLLVIALATTAPLVTGLAGTAWCLISVRSFKADDGDGPSQKARRLAENISETMNLTGLVVIGAAVVSGVALATSRWGGRRQPR